MREGWRSQFDEHILGRGLDYFLTGKVEMIDMDELMVRSVVRGSEDYHVKIDFVGQAACNMECDCPYALDGNNCKHMAAVLFAWRSIKLKELDGADS